MKLKTKLAKEYAGKNWVKNTDAYNDARTDFLAGFKEARKLAAERMQPVLRSMISRSEAAQICNALGEEEAEK